jgi:hypothetical protein
MGQLYRKGDRSTDHQETVRQYVERAAMALSDDEVLDLADLLHDLLRARRAQRRMPQSYAILQAGDEWQIVCSRRRMGHFQTRDLALQAGARLAGEARRAGHEVELLVQEMAGELRRLDLQAFASRPLSA